MAVTGFELTRLPREARTVRVAALLFAVLLLFLFHSTATGGAVPARSFACVSAPASDTRPWSPTVEPAEDSERRTSTGLPASGRAVESLPAHLAAAYHRAPVEFEENRGQAGAGVRFVARGAGYQLFLTDREVFVRMTAVHRPPADHARGAMSSRDSSVSTRPVIDQAVVKLRFAGSMPTSARGEQSTQARTHYVRSGSTAPLARSVRSYSRVRYAEVYPAIDLVLYGTHREIEYDLVVRPGGDPQHIRLAFDGAESISVDSEGNLVLSTALGELKQRRPVVYQEIDGERRLIEARYVLEGPFEVALDIGRYDSSFALVIDPVIAYVGYLGGANDDAATALAVDEAGNTYVAGYTMSTDFPLASPYDRKIGRPDIDVFVAKFNPSGSALIYSTYLGGPLGRDMPSAIAVDGSGSVYVTGQTSAGDFPTTTGAYQKGTAGGGSFVAKLAPGGSALAYATYVLGATTSAIAVDPDGRVLLTGAANSAFVTTAGAFQPASRSPAGTNAFAARLEANGRAMSFATFLGGAASDVGTGVAVAPDGSVVVAGHTTSHDFPVRNAQQPSLAGSKDGFVARLDSSGAVLVHATFLGGLEADAVHALALDSGGSAYVTGETYSSDFPVRNAFQGVKPGYRLLNRTLGSAFVAKLAVDGHKLAYSSFLGGEVCTSTCQSSVGGGTYAGDVAYAIAVDRTGHAVITGISRSYDMPVTSFLAPRKQSDNEQSLFVAKVGAAGLVLLHSTLVHTATTGYELENGMPMAAGSAIALDASGNPHVASAASFFTRFTPTTGAYQTALRGLDDAVVLKLRSSEVAVGLDITPSVLDARTPVSLSASVQGASEGTVTFYAGASVHGTVALANGVATRTTTLPAGIHTITAVYRGAGAEGDSRSRLAVVNPYTECN
jgi:hypothetical protein